MATRPLLREGAIKDLIDKKAISPNTVLEIGYGGGDMLRNLRSWFPKASIFGYDFSDLAFQYADSLDIGVWLLESQEQCEEQEYEMLCAFEVLEHIRDDVETLEQWRMLIQSDGYLLLSMPAHMRKWQINDDVSGHFRRYERVELIQKLSDAGFANIEVINYGFPVTLILDTLLAVLAKSEAKHSSKDMAIRTRESGLRKKVGLKGKLFSQARRFRFVFSPVLMLQRLFYRYDLSSAYVVIAQNKNVAQ